MPKDDQNENIPRDKKKSGLDSKTEKQQKKWWKKWYTQLIIILSLILMLLQLRKEVKEFWQVIAGKPSVTTLLKGIVTDSLNNKPISGAVVKIDKIPGDSVITTSDGSFKFNKVPGKVGDDVRIYIYARGYNPRNEYKALPGPVDIKLGKSN